MLVARLSPFESILVKWSQSLVFTTEALTWQYSYALVKMSKKDYSHGNLFGIR